MPDHYTPILALPYPDIDDPADVPADLQQLCLRLDALSGSGSSGSLLKQAPILDVGMQGQLRAGRQLIVADFTTLGLAQPIGLWNLSDLSNLGSDARALSNKGAVPFGVGINGLAATSAVFAGSASQALYIPDSGVADPLRIRTGSFGCWFRTAKRGTAQVLMSKYVDNTATRAWWLGMSNVNNVLNLVYSTDGTNTSVVNAVSDVCDDRWHHVVVAHDATVVRLYVDGVVEASTSVAGPLPGSTAPFDIGAYSADASAAATLSHYGRVDEAFVSADVLTEDQVRGLYCASIPHALGVTPGAVRLSVHRRRKGAPLAVADFTTQPLRLHNFTAGALTDQGSGAQALTNNGAALSVAGADGTPGGAYSFAAAQTLSATDAGLPSGLAARSYGCWLKTTLVGSIAIMGWGTLSTGDERLATTAQGLIASVSGADTVTGSFVADGQWHLAVVVEDNAAGDGVRRKLFLDGRLVGGSTVLGSVTLAGASRFRVGANPDGSGPFTGQIDGAFVTGYAMAQDEILRLYAKASQDLGASPKEPGAHVERLDSSALLWVADTLESQQTVDIGLVI
jgi:hypothetical protein